MPNILPRCAGELPGPRRLRSRELQRRARLGIALLWMFAVAPASAQNSAGDLALIWDAPRECPDRGVVQAAIAKHLREPRKFLDDWRIEARVVRKRSQFELELNLGRVGAEPARRTLLAARCAALVEATAVFVALALAPQPSAAGAGPSADAAAEPAAPPNPSPPAPSPGDGATRSAPAAASPVEAQAVSPAPASPKDLPPRDAPGPTSSSAAAADGGGSRAFGVGIGAGVRLAAGMLPAARTGPFARVELRWLRLRAALGFSWLPPVETVAENYPNASIRASAFLGEALVGYALLDERLSLVPCAAFEYGALSLASRRIETPDSQSVRWVAAGAGARAAYRLAAGFELSLEATGLAPFSRPRLWLRTDRGDLTLFDAAAVAVRISAGIAYVFE